MGDEAEREATAEEKSKNFGGGPGVALVQIPPSSDRGPVAGIFCRGCGSLGRLLRGLDLGRMDLSKVDGAEASEAIRRRFASRPGLVVDWAYGRVLMVTDEDGPCWSWTCPKCVQMSGVSHLVPHLREQLFEFIGRWPPEAPGVEQPEVVI